MFYSSDVFPDQSCRTALHNNRLHKSQVCQNQKVQPNLTEMMLRLPVWYQTYNPGQLVQASIVNISPLGVTFKVMTLVLNMTDHSGVVFEERKAVLVLIPFSRIIRTESYELQIWLSTKTNRLTFIHKVTCKCMLRSHKGRI